MNALYQGTLTDVSQNYGNKDEKRVKKSIWTSVASVAVVGIVLGSLTAIFARPLLNIYITDSPEALEYGVIRIFYIGIPYFLCGIMEVLAGAMRGLGKSLMPTAVALMGACVFRIGWLYTVFAWMPRLEILYISYPLSWILTAGVHAVCLIFAYRKVKRSLPSAE